MAVGCKVAIANGPYTSSEFARKAVSDASCREVEPLEVKVIVVQPGAVTTEMFGRVRAYTSNT
jgi:NADP-dependent 3-hydroxy acid dehydrogenase YdfG